VILAREGVSELIFWAALRCRIAKWPRVSGMILFVVKVIPLKLPGDVSGLLTALPQFPDPMR
jgi:hypothetical protein